MSLPIVKKDDRDIYTLYVNDKPFFCRSGEIHNSSASNKEYMDREVWDRLHGLNMNTVIVPVYWEQIEPEENKYDFSMVSHIIIRAREEKMKLIFLWFGLWKNSESMYVPGWMKRDVEKYDRVKKVNGENLNIISPLCQNAVEKDKAAFMKLMDHIKETDEKETTVIAIQVENEIGVLGSERDYSKKADEAFNREIPTQLRELYETGGTWKEAFGEDAEEYFMAYYYAEAVEEIASAGKSVYDLPCYTNAWLRQYPWYKGSYPTGGPVRNVHKIWKAIAKSLFTLAPDIYVPYCADVMDEYAYEENPLFIPEIRKDAVAASYCLYAFFAKNAICFSPFGIEELSLDPSEVDKPPMEVMMALNIDPSAFEIAGSKEKLSAAYGLIENMEHIYLKYRGTQHLKSVVRHGENDYGALLTFENYDLAIAYSPRIPEHPLGSASVFEIAENSFVIVGTECSVNFRVKSGENMKVDYLKLEEGIFVDGEWKPGRILNGDEKMALKFGDMPKAYLVELFKY